MRSARVQAARWRRRCCSSCCRRARDRQGRAAKARRRRQGDGGARDARAGRIVHATATAAALWWSPVAPAVGQPMKIMAVGDGGGDLTVTDPQGDEKALTTVRHDGPPSSLTAEFTPARAGNHQLIWRRGGKPIACRKIPVAAKPAAPVDGGRRERLGVGARLGSALREPLLGLDRDAVRRADRPVAGLPAAAPGAARSGAQLPLRLPRPARGRPEEQGGDRGDARLRRPAVLPARLFLVEARAAVRVPRLRSRDRIAAAALHDVLQQRRRADAGRTRWRR